MPIPTPTESETREDFMERCLSDETMNEEYPDNDQRVAICSQSWRDRNKEESEKMEKIIKIFDTFEVKASKDDRTLEFIGSKEITDRDKEIVKIKGMDLKNFKTNPVVLWAHQYDQPPVAKATKVWKSGDELKFKVKFAEMEEYGFADTIYKLYRGGYMSAVSIGFIPDYDSIEYPKKGAQRIFNKSELIELSLVPVGANPAALLSSKGIQKAIEDKAIDDGELEEMKLYLEECEECEDLKEDKKILINERDIKTIEDAEEIKEQYGYTELVCDKCGKTFEEELKEKTEENINITETEDVIDELLSVLRAEKEALEKRQKKESLDEIIQILKEDVS